MHRPALAAAWLLVSAMSVLAQPVAAPPRVAVMGDVAAVVARLDAARLMAAVAIRLEVADLAAPALEAQLAALERRRVPLWLVVSAPVSVADVDTWRRSLRAIASRRASTLMLLEIAVDARDPAVAMFAVQAAATDARAARDTVQVALGGDGLADPVRRAAVYSPALAPYVDVAVVAESVAAEIQAWLTTADPGARVAVISAPAGNTPLRRFVDATVDDVATGVTLRAWRLGDLQPPVLEALPRLGPLLTGDVEPLDTAAARLVLAVDGRNVADEVSHRLFFDTRQFSTSLVLTAATAAPLRIAVTVPIEGAPRVRGLLTGAESVPAGYVRDAASGRVELVVAGGEGPQLVEFNADGTSASGERGEVTAPRALSVAEIIARHQQAEAAQAAVVRHFMASARMRQHFRPNIADPGYDVVTENRYYVEGTAVEWEERSFSVNGSRWEQDRPPFPLLQPEKVLSLPLQLRFDDGYRYRLDGTERVDGVDCYVVRFEPERRDASLYRGTVWIDRRTFARVRVHAVQGGLAAPVVANEETLRYVQAGTVGNRPVVLFAGLTARQTVLLAGRNLTIEKDVTFSDFRINDPAFEQARAAARSSDRIMYRETERGLRYYVKQDGERVISENLTTSVKAMAMGVYLDPSYAFPLPIFGINYLSFGTGSSSDRQLALLFGGVLVAGNVQQPKLGSTPFDASVDFFAIAAPSSDRLYLPGGEAADQRVLTWPLSTGVNLGWQATPHQKATLQYQLRYDAYVRDRTTAETFAPPSSTVTNGIGGAWEYRRHGYSVTLNGTWFARSRWKAWGPASAPIDPAASRTYVKYGAGVSRTVLVGPFQTVHVNANWFGGADLDRFVAYQFGMFEDTRIHGVPASGVRFQSLAMVRGAYSLNIFEMYRADLFLEHAWGRDGQAGWQRLPGVGGAVNFRTFWNTILRVEAGRSVLPPAYDGLGSTTMQILLLKPLR